MCIAGGKITDCLTIGRVDADRNDSALASRRNVSAHQHIYFEGDGRDRIFVVETGWVKLYRTLIDGQRQIVGFANPGTILGLESDMTHLNSAEAITDVVVRAIPVSALRNACRRDSDFADMLLRQSGRQLAAAQAHIATIGAQSAEQKLATFLIQIADLCGADGSAEFDLPMRRGDMAEFLGLRLETVSRKMTELQRRGLIRMTSLYRCQMLRRGVLESLAEGGEDPGAPMLRAV